MNLQIRLHCEHCEQKQLLTLVENKYVTTLKMSLKFIQVSSSPVCQYLLLNILVVMIFFSVVMWCKNICSFLKLTKILSNFSCWLEQANIHISHEHTTKNTQSVLLYLIHNHASSNPRILFISSHNTMLFTLHKILSMVWFFFSRTFLFTYTLLGVSKFDPLFADFHIIRELRLYLISYFLPLKICEGKLFWKTCNFMEVNYDLLELYWFFGVRVWAFKIYNMESICEIGKVHTILKLTIL